MRKKTQRAEAIFDQLPTGWVSAPVGEVLELVNGFAFKSSQWKQQGLPIVRIQNLNNPNAPFNYCPETVPEKFRISDGDLLFAWSGTPGTSFGAHIWKRGKAWLNQHIFRIIFRPDCFDPKFLQLAINQNLSRYIEAAHGGAGLAHITKKKFEASLLRIAPLEEQRRITEALDEIFSDLDAGVDAQRRVQKKLEIYRAAILRAAAEGRLTARWREQHPATETASELLERILTERRCHWEEKQTRKIARKKLPKDRQTRYLEPPGPDCRDLPLLPDNWCWVNLGQLKLFSLYGPRFSSENYSSDGILVLRTSDINDSGKVNLSTAPRLELKDRDFQDYKLVPGDIVFTRTGSIGRLAVFDDDVAAIPGAYLIQYRLAFGGALSRYLFHFFKSPAGQNHLLGRTAGIGRPNLNAPSIESVPIPLPPLDEQAAIVEAVEEQLSVIDHLESDIEAKLEASQMLRHAILHRAFTGQLVSQDPNDEPADEILKHIAAERAKRSTPISKRLPRRAKTC